jgi:hypothetical protein
MRHWFSGGVAGEDLAQAETFASVVRPRLSQVRSLAGAAAARYFGCSTRVRVRVMGSYLDFGPLRAITHLLINELGHDKAGATGRTL